MSDETIVDTLRKASMAIYIAVDEETAKQISITFTRAAERHNPALSRVIIHPLSTVILHVLCQYG